MEHPPARCRGGSLTAIGREDQYTAKPNTRSGEGGTGGSSPSAPPAHHIRGSSGEHVAPQPRGHRHSETPHPDSLGRGRYADQSVLATSMASTSAPASVRLQPATGQAVGSATRFRTPGGHGSTPARPIFHARRPSRRSASHHHPPPRRPLSSRSGQPLPTRPQTHPGVDHIDATRRHRDERRPPARRRTVHRSTPVPRPPPAAPGSTVDTHLPDPVRTRP